MFLAAEEKEAADKHVVRQPPVGHFLQRLCTAWLIPGSFLSVPIRSYLSRTGKCVAAVRVALVRCLLALLEVSSLKALLRIQDSSTNLEI